MPSAHRQDAQATAAAASFAQERLWLAEQIAPSDPAYNLRFAAALDGPLDAGRLARGVEAVVARHEPLRTCFAVLDGELRQVILSDVPVALPVIDLSGLPAPQEAARRLAQDEFGRPFALDHAPLLRVRLLRTGPRRHVLLLTLHHIVADAWSRAILVRELAAAYQALGAGEAPALPPLPIQYADFAAWQRGLPVDDDLAYWEGRLADLPILELPSDRARPAAGPRRGAALRCEVGAGLADRLRRLARREDASLFMVLLAGFLAVISRYCGQTDVAVGTAVADRPRRETQELIGFFVNLLVLRVDLAGDPSLRECVARTARVCKEAYDHGGAPFERVVGRVAAERDPARNPLFQVVFQMPGGLEPEVRLDGTSTRPFEVDDPTTVFDLQCTVTEHGGAVSCELRYATERWDRSAVERLLPGWLAVLDAMAADPDTRLHAVALLSSADRARLDAWNATARDLPEPATLDRIVAACAARAPERTALVDRRGSWTYAQLIQRANQMARAVRAAGAGVDTPVGILLERSADLVVGMLGTLFAGAAYVVLDPGYPAERLEFMVRDLGMAAVVVRDAAAHPWLAAGGAPVVELEAARRFPGGDVAARSLPDALANVVFTSGSTGRPKGVGIPHRAAVRLIANTDYVRIGRDDVVIHLGDPSFDITTFEVWGALCNEARLVVLPGDEPLGPDEVIAAVLEHRPTVLSLTGTLFNQVVDADPAIFGALRCLLVVGEVMDPGRTRRVLRHGAPQQILNGYGPTENTTFSACYRADRLPDSAVTVPIGTAVENTTLYVLDDELERVPIGAPGELYVAGLGLARGYLGRPGLTAERFLPDPFGSQPGGRMYRTGDQVRLRPDGNLVFLGRADQQLKVRGHRIEPGEIEAALRARAGVRDCAVRLAEIGGDKRLVAYVAAGAGCELDAPALLAELRTTLPGFLVPNHVVLLDELPRTSSGKLDTRALPTVQASLNTPGAASSSPRTEHEQAVWDSWADALGVRGFGVYDDFFLLGGHSLLATVVVAALRERFRIDLPLRALFDAPTVGALAAEIERREAAARGGAPDPLDELLAGLERLSTEGNAAT